MMRKAISILSAGMDSGVSTALLSREYDISAITFDYGQRSAQMEVRYARKLSEYLGIEHRVIELPWLGELGGSVLTDDGELPSPGDLDDVEECLETARKVWVPGRNIVFTSVGVSFAEALDADAVIVGWDREEAATFPDNSREFLEAFNSLLGIGTLRGVRVLAPVIDMTKKEIVEAGMEMDFPFELTYSCYTGEDVHCGVCESCLRRRRAFELAGAEDPTEYRE
ncbi:MULTISPECIES: 7-cyano-7-deazaguanine synthase QueC [Methanothermobacter]|uniref:7-cyano-7-deazaguanine synthase n=1 Tax=Methanothermobacter wolfeii TaxID=145261 RepID=A0A9E7RS61_METWO|nr:MULTISPECIES: 7-cyano-7-deazaguanine synthase QueC [Methanothermobacter]UXH31390.1 7-cyano-7-deazaguanine synthase QueC [Methanothermobacter wolfeii]